METQAQYPRPVKGCNHGLTFDAGIAATEDLTVEDVRRRWPRLDGRCPHCGFFGVAYASYLHYMAGGWR